MFLELAREPVEDCDGEKMVDPAAKMKGWGTLRSISKRYQKRLTLGTGRCIFLRASVSDFLALGSSKRRIVQFLHYSPLSLHIVVSSICYMFLLTVFYSLLVSTNRFFKLFSTLK